MNTAGRPSAFARKPGGLTLVELLVVIAIIGILMAILVPAVQSAREQARRLTCLARLAELAKAAESHRLLLGHYPTGGWNQDWVGAAGNGNNWRQPGGWCFLLLPHLEQQNLYDLAASSPSTFVGTNVPSFTCPTRRANGLLAAGADDLKNGGTVDLGSGRWMRTDYAGNHGAWCSFPVTPTANDITNRATTFGLVGVNTPPTSYPAQFSDEFIQDMKNISMTLNQSQIPPSATFGAVQTGGVIFAGSSVSSGMISDGQGTTYLFAEKYVPMTMYEDGAAPGNEQCAYVGDSSSTLRGGQRPPESDSTLWPSDTASQSVLLGVFGGPHVGVFHVATCDSAVRSIDFTIDPQVHFLLSSRCDRQPVLLP